MPIGGSKENYLITASINGVNYGVFDSWKGGESLAKSIKHRPGGMKTEQSFPSLPVHGELTVSRVEEHDRDWEPIRSLRQLGGRVVGNVTLQPLDQDGNVYGSSQTAQGRFLGVTGLEGDSNADALSMFELRFDVERWV